MTTTVPYALESSTQRRLEAQHEKEGGLQSKRQRKKQRIKLTSRMELEAIDAVDPEDAER